MSEWFITVAVPRPVRSDSGGLFSYKIPEPLVSTVEKGSIVSVPFGKSKTHAFVVEKPKPAQEWTADFSFDRLREVENIVQSGSDLLGNEFFRPEIFRLCEWASQYYQAPLGEVMSCAIPKAILGQRKRKSKSPPNTDQLVRAPAETIHLNEEQIDAVEGIAQDFSHPALLEGVTGSGKTEVYLELTEKMLKQEKGVLILVPEIALTPQILDRFNQRFPNQIAMWHSALAVGQRRDLMVSVLKREKRIVIGARSAIFAPVPDLGLIIVDEEHDVSYKQEDRVRYQARDLAFVRASSERLGLVLGSATPSLETLQKVESGKVRRFLLTKQATQFEKSEIKIVSLLENERVENVETPLAQETLSTMQAVLEEGHQILVLLNRKGFAHFLMCPDCRWVAQCENCSLSMTVHQRGRMLRCHTCGDERATPHTCPKCFGNALDAVGCGTERLEEELKTLFPNVTSLRLDRDQVTSQTRLEKILTDFRDRKAQILFGTQMLTKGHDFPGVKLVVVILADGYFRFPDFRSTERAVQSLLQVSGRAGRHLEKGLVLIQTFDPFHPVLEVVKGNLSLTEWRAQEMSQRSAALYPPAVRICKIRMEHKEEDKALAQIQEMADEMARAFPQITLVGPSEAFIPRVKGWFRADLLVKSSQASVLRSASQFCRELGNRKKWQCIVDIDPSSLN